MSTLRSLRRKALSHITSVIPSSAGTVSPRKERKVKRLSAAQVKHLKRYVPALFTKKVVVKAAPSK